MHIAMIIDEQRLSQEQAMLNRLCVGLTGEGVKVTRIVPDSVSTETVLAGESRMALLPRIETAMDVLPWTRRPRAERLVSILEDSPPDVFYAVGHKAQPIASDLAELMHRPAVFDVWSNEYARQIRPDRSPSAVTAYIAASHALAELLQSRVGADRVHCVPMGVATSAMVQRQVRGEMDEPAIAIVGSARDMPAYEAMLSGLSRVAKEVPTLQIFLELRGTHEHDIWRHARNLDLLRAISALGEASQYRALLTHCDLMLLPERSGELRSIMLEAMALGVPIVAGRGGVVDSWESEQAAILVSPTDSDEWSQQIQRLLTQQHEAHSFGIRGQQIMRDRHSSNRQLFSLIAVMERVVGGGGESSNRTEAELQRKSLQIKEIRPHS